MRRNQVQHDQGQQHSLISRYVDKKEKALGGYQQEQLPEHCCQLQSQSCWGPPTTPPGSPAGQCPFAQCPVVLDITHTRQQHVCHVSSQTLLRKQSLAKQDSILAALRLGKGMQRNLNNVDHSLYLLCNGPCTSEKMQLGKPGALQALLDQVIATMTAVLSHTHQNCADMT